MQYILDIFGESLVKLAGLFTVAFISKSHIILDDVFGD